MIVKNPISNFFNHRSDSIKIAYFSGENFDEVKGILKCNMYHKDKCDNTHQLTDEDNN